MARYLPTSSDNKCKLGLSFNKEVAGSLGVALGVYEGLVGSGVLFGIFLSISGSGSSFSYALFFGSIAGGLVVSEQLGVSSTLLLNVFGDNSCPKTNT